MSFLLLNNMPICTNWILWVGGRGGLFKQLLLSVFYSADISDEGYLIPSVWSRFRKKAGFLYHVVIQRQKWCLSTNSAWALRFRALAKPSKWIVLRTSGPQGQEHLEHTEDNFLLLINDISHELHAKLRFHGIISYCFARSLCCTYDMIWRHCLALGQFCFRFCTVLSLETLPKEPYFGGSSMTTPSGTFEDAWRYLLSHTHSDIDFSTECCASFFLLSAPALVSRLQYFLPLTLWYYFCFCAAAKPRGTQFWERWTC